jgi:hypothetical protein
MSKLLVCLRAYDRHLLTVIANRWDVDLPKSFTPEEAAQHLAAVMLLPDRAEQEWLRLNDRERAALQVLLAAKNRQMGLGHYSRLFGEIRVMGEDKRAREKPHLDPTGIAEVLFYRGLLSYRYDKDLAGNQQFVYVPEDLAAVLPSHLTGYDLSQAEEEAFEEEEEEQEAGLPIELVHQANTALVDDLTTLLAYLQIENVAAPAYQLPEFDGQALEDYLLGPASPARYNLMLALIAALGLAAEQEEGFFKPFPQKLRAWLDLPRPQQVRSLVETWEHTGLYNELAQLPHLILAGGQNWPNDPLLLRKILREFMGQAPENDWFSLPAFIAAIKNQQPDFQRPAGNYEVWHLREAETEAFLRGFETWDQVEGAMLSLALSGSLHFLGLLDLGQQGEKPMLRLNAYGRAWLGKGPWPNIQYPDTPLKIQSDGTIYASRNLKRYERFQVARFTEWGPPGELYEYQLTPDSFAQAEGRGIKAEHILSFLRRAAQEQVPPEVEAWLVEWGKTSGLSVTLRGLVILETLSAEELDGLMDLPAVRRFLGTRLGPRAVAVRQGQEAALEAALREQGVKIETP